jgi:hypothetical protein
MAEHDDTDLRTAAKAAAATAAVGAAVGVARAIAARAEEAARRDDHDDDDGDHEDPETEPVPEAAPAAPDTAHDDEDDEPEPEPVPVQGTSVDRLRRLTRTARELLEELNGAEVESISAIDKTRDGWRVTLETVEVRRVPDSMDVMATYDVELDGDGDLVRYDRRRRYARAQSDHGDGG